MMNYFFIDYIHFNIPLTAKLRRLKIFLIEFEGALLTSKEALKDAEVSIRDKLKSLNQQYPRTEPLVMDKVSFSKHGHWILRIRCKEKTDDIFNIHIKKINKVFSV